MKITFMAAVIFASSFGPINSPAQKAPAETGVHLQLHELLTAVRGKRIGMITNPAGCDELGKMDADTIIASGQTTISAFFSPEHGLRGVLQAGKGDKDYIDPITSIPVYAVFGVRRAPTDEQLKRVDALVYDLQDVGARFYTFMWTTTECMEAAARNHKPFYIIDRPNPITGVRVEGGPNSQDYGLIGRLGTGAAFGLATRHGMTVGEIATMWNDAWTSQKADLHVIKMDAWTRNRWWDQTGRKFINPSPNLRSLEAAVIYPGTCVFEGTNISEGRGTTSPFEMIGAPFIDGKLWAKALSRLGQKGVRFEPVQFTPSASKHKDAMCGGVRVIVTDRNRFLPVHNGLEMLQTAYKLYPDDVKITSAAARLMAIPELENRIKTDSIARLESEQKPLLRQFLALRAKYLLYPNENSREAKQHAKPVLKGRRKLN